MTIMTGLLLAAIQPLWPEGRIPDFREDQYAAPWEEASARGFDRASHRMPYLEWSEAPTNANGACVILVSGGGWRTTCDGPGFRPLERMLLDNGVTCAWLWYRVPYAPDLPIHQFAWEDGQRAVRLVRAAARGRGFDPERIGVLGCSAGSHLAVLLGASSQTNVYARVDEIDDIPCHVNFAIPMCVARVLSDGLCGPNSRRGDGADLAFIPELLFDGKTCPMCFIHGADDPYSPFGATRLYRRLRDAGVAAEVHIDPARGHGPASPAIFGRAIEFMRQMGYLGPVGEEVLLMSRFASDDDRGTYEKEDLWPAGAMPDAQTNQCAPYVEWHLPKELKTKAVQVIYSGGAYRGSSTDSFEVAPMRRFLNGKGMAVVTLRYRAPRPEGLPIYLSAWQDLQRAIRLVRSRAAEKGLDPDRIGVMGSSAGGHLTLLGATSARHPAYWPKDEVDRLPCNVQWAVAIYPAYSLADDKTWSRNRGLDNGGNKPTVRPAPEFSFDLDTCPTLFIHGDDDVWQSINSVVCWEQQRRMGVLSELHTLAARGHCFQREAAPGTGSYTWNERVLDFISRFAPELKE